MLEGANEEELKKYNEKVVDFDLTLNPTSAEASSIAFKQNNAMTAMITEAIQRLGINNIRIIRKIELHAAQLLSYLPAERFHRDLIKQVLDTLCLYCWSRYDSGKHVPTMAYIKQHNSFSGKDDLDEQQQEWRQSLVDYSYSTTDELDLEIAAYLENGYVNKEAFLVEANKMNAKADSIALEKQFSQTWRLYHDSLEDNQQEVLDKLYASFKLAVKCISPMNMNGTVLLFKDLGENVRAQELLNYYIEQRSDEPELFDLENRDSFVFETPLPEVAAAFQQKYQSLTQENPTSLADIIIGVVEGRIRMDKYLNILVSASEEEYYTFYKSFKGKGFRPYLDVFLVNQGYDDVRQKIGNKVAAVIKRLASDSTINRRRLKGYVTLSPAVVSNNQSNLTLITAAE